MQRTCAFYTFIIRMQHQAINIWKNERNFHETGSEIRDCAVCFSFARLLENQGKHLSKFLLKCIVVQRIVCCGS